MISPPNPFFPFLFIISFCIFLTACRNKIDNKQRDKVNLDQDVTNRQIPRDSIFLQFDKNWKKFISPSQELVKPVVVQHEEQPTWQPVIITDCIYSQEAGGAVPQVELTWQEPASQKTVRFDIALQSQGFERNYYTTAFPVEPLKRFNIPMQSELVHDTAAVLLSGPAMFPKIAEFRKTSMQGAAIDTSHQPPVRNLEKTGTPALEEAKLKIVELGSGLSYKIRMCTFNGESWSATQEIIFNTPICPTDRQ